MSRALSTLLFLALLGLALLVRLPFLTQVMIGEEGSFAYLVAGSPTASSVSADGLPQMMIGILDRQPALYPFQRTILPYILLEDGPGAILRGLDVMTWPESMRTAVVRGAFLSLYLLGIVGLLWRASRISTVDMPLALAVTVFAISAPLTVGASVQPQIDGALGVLLTGWAALLLTSARSMPPKVTLLLAGTAGALVGCGRHEWSIAFLGGLALLAASLLLLRPAPEARRRAQHTALAVSAGLILGWGLSMALSPSEFFSGFAVQRRVTGVQSPLVLLQRDYLHVVGAATLLALLAVMLVWNLRQILIVRPGTIIVSGAAATLFAGSVSVGWPGDGFPRYYAPVFSLAAIALVSICALPGRPDGRSWRIAHLCMAAALVAGTAAQGMVVLRTWKEQRSITANFGMPLTALREEYAQVASDAQAGGYLPLTHAGIWMSYPDLSFLSRDMGVQEGRIFLERMHPEWAVRLQR